MENRLGMTTVQTIVTLHRRGWSFRRIARALDIHRETVARLTMVQPGVTSMSVKSSVLMKTCAPKSIRQDWRRQLLDAQSELNSIRDLS
ncbi:MAG: helix-turn-helix domain-containing protein [Phycisphaerales bacterium]|nr:helix-turn-helix domain-containing protein [Phycisphaerales bacterium]